MAFMTMFLGISEKSERVKLMNIKIKKNMFRAIVLIGCLSFSHGFTMKARSAENKSTIQLKYGSVSQGLRCSIHPEKKEFKANDPIILTITIENVSKNVSSYFESKPDLDFVVDSKMENGSIVTPTAFAKAIPEMPFYGRFVRNIKSGQRITYKLAANRLIDMTRSGIYNITIRRFVLNQPNKDTQIKTKDTTVKPTNGLMIFKEPIDSPVVSNTIQVKVVEPDASRAVISPPDTDTDAKAVK